MKILYFLLFLLFTSSTYTFGNDAVEFVDLGKFTQQSINQIIGDSHENPLVENKIEAISQNFLNVPYLGYTLIGSINKQEILTINLSGMDCFTYIDYVEAIRSSSDYNSFKDQVKNIRYKDGIVEYRARNHFFSDWPLNNSSNVKDITEHFGSGNIITVKKYLNLKNDGSNYLDGIPVVERDITYIPTDKISSDVIDKMNTGDYIGIYSKLDGLDVSHTGIVVKKNGKAFIRHASSRKINKKVVDEDLIVYLKNKPGIVVYRPI